MGIIRKSFTESYRKQTIKELAISQLSIRDFARQKKIGVSTIARWKHDYANIYEAYANGTPQSDTSLPHAEKLGGDVGARVLNALAPTTLDEMDILRRKLAEVVIDRDRLAKFVDMLLAKCE
jgi:transposase